MTTIRCPLNESARMSPNQAGLASADGALLYTEVEQCVTATAQLLAQRGVREGERIGLALPNRWEQVILFWALLRTGAAACPIDARIVGLIGLDELIRRSGICRVVGQAPPAGAGLPPVEWLDASKLTGFAAPFKARTRPKLELGREAAVLWTHEPQPVPVAHTIAACYYGALAGNATQSFRSKDRWLLPPLTSYGGIDIIFRAFLAGAIPVAGHEQGADAETLQELEITHLTLHPRQVDAFLELVDAGEGGGVKSVLVIGALDTARQDALLKANIAPIMALGDQHNGFYAVVGRGGELRPMKYSALRMGEGGVLEISQRDAAWRATDWRVKPQTGEGLMIEPTAKGSA